MLPNIQKGTSMSTSLLYHGYGITGYKYIRSYFKNGEIIFKIAHDHFSLCCSECRSKNISLKGKYTRLIRSLPIGSKPVFIELPIQRIRCHQCDTVRQVKIKFADERRTYSRAFERYALELSKSMTIKDVARHLRVGWDLIKEIQKRYLGKKYSKPSLKNIEQIAIDEINIGKGHNYLTVVLNLQTGAIIFVGDGKGAEALKPFWRRLNHAKKRIKSVAIDMSPAYISAVLENLPEAVLVFDHFHVIKLFNDKLSKLRRDIQREAEGPLQQKVLKGTRWLLLKNPENLNDDRNEKDRLKDALKLNKPLATAYYLKEDLRQIWKQTDKAEAKKVLLSWMEKARSSKIRILMKFANTLAKHSFGILNYYDYPISTGPLEGTNNKIKTLQKTAYGFRDMDFFKLKIHALHETRYALVG